ncbi:MAG: hypothetical protein ACI36W_01805 [Coriobacteriales bacterium]
MDHWLVFNVMAYDRLEGDEELRALLEYMATGRVDSPGSLQDLIAAEVDSINHDEEKVREMFTAEQTVQMECERRAFEKGEDKGKAEGLIASKAEGSERAARLCALLVEMERCEDITRMGSDPAYREQLCAELGI